MLLSQWNELRVTQSHLGVIGGTYGLSLCSVWLIAVLTYEASYFEFGLTYEISFKSCLDLYNQSFEFCLTWKQFLQSCNLWSQGFKEQFDTKPVIFEQYGLEKLVFFRTVWLMKPVFSI